MEERYERLEEIGRGGIGSVFRGLHIPLRRDVAIKEIKEIFNLFGDLQKDDIIERFEKAVQDHARLVHPNIIQILDIDLDRQFPIFVMEYAPGGSLRQVLDGPNKPNLGAKLRMFLHVCQALRYAHRQGVIHTDLKPSNVVFDADGNAKVVDFGISRIIERDSSKQQIYIGVGTVAYLSPEQFRNPLDANERSDIYSLGIMFYEMLTGKLPGRRSPMPSSFFPDIPRKLDDIFDNMCMDAEEDRYQSFDAVITDLMSSPEVGALLGASAPAPAGVAAPPRPAPAPPRPTTVERPAAPAPAAPMAPPPEPAPVPEPAPIFTPEPAPEPVFEALVEAASASSADESGDEEAGDSNDILSMLDKYGENF